MTANRHSLQHRFIDTIHVFIALNSGFLFVGVILTWVSVQFYHALLGGGPDLYPGYYKGLGQILRFLPFGLVYWPLPKSKWGVEIYTATAAAVANWTVSRSPSAAMSFCIGKAPAARAFTLTGLSNYTWYTITLNAIRWCAVPAPLRPIPEVMAGDVLADHLCSLRIVQPATGQSPGQNVSCIRPGPCYRRGLFVFPGQARVERVGQVKSPPEINAKLICFFG
jgi:hypothetical protein